MSIYIPLFCIITQIPIGSLLLRYFIFYDVDALLESH